MNMDQKKNTGCAFTAIFRGIFLIGTTLLLLVCVAGFFGLFEAPPEFYAIFWGGFIFFLGTIRVVYWLMLAFGLIDRSIY